MTEHRKMEIDSILANLMDSEPTCLTGGEMKAIQDLRRYTIILEEENRNLTKIK